MTKKKCQEVRADELVTNGNGLGLEKMKKN